MKKIKTLTIEEILDVISDWNVKHHWQVRDETGLLEGTADPNKRTINLSDNTFKAERVYSLIHEIIHATDFQKGYGSNEKETERRTNESYREIYGHSFMR